MTDSDISPAAKKQIEEWERRQREERAGAPVDPLLDVAQSGGSDAADDYSQPDTGGYWDEYVRARSFRVIRRRVKAVLLVVILLAAYIIPVSTNYGATNPFSSKKADFLLVCWDKSGVHSDAVKDRVKDLMFGTFNELWWNLWWGGHPVIIVREPTPMRASMKWMVQIENHASVNSQLCPTWASIQKYRVSDLKTIPRERWK